MRRAERAMILAAALASARPVFADDCKRDARHPDDCKAVQVVVTGTRTPESSQRATVRTDFVARQEAERARVAYRLSTVLNPFVGALNLTDSHRRSLDVTDTRFVIGRQFTSV